MTDEDEPVQHCELAEQVDLLSALEAAAIDHLEVDEHRAIVIYQHAILMVIVTEGPVTSAQAFDIELWNPPAHDPDRDPDALLTSFIDELVTTTDTTRVES
jgi:hypothetical protein